MAAHRTGAFALHLWRLARPEVWMVSVLPAMTGWVLATRQLVPGLGLWTAFWHAAATGGATSGEFSTTLFAWLLAAGDLLLALVVLGPVLWTATLLINDVHDLPADRVNPRKASSPLVQGLVDVGAAHIAAYVFAAFALALAWLVNPTFLLLVLACVVLAWLYSVPPVRLKARPGADLVVNALGVGALAAMAGWAVARPLAAFPWMFLPQGLLVAAAIYVPTTLVDRESDAAMGIATLATHLGERAAYRIGWLAWVLANLGAVVLAWTDTILPRRMLPVLVLFGPLLLWEYHRFIGQARSPEARIEGIVLTSLTFAAVNAVFALMYTGLWAP